MASGVVDERRLGVTELVAVDATAVRVVDVVGRVRGVHGEVDVGAVGLLGDKGHALDAAEADRERRAVGAGDELRLICGKVDDRERRGVALLAADDELAARERRRAGAAGKARVHNGVRPELAALAERDHVELAVARHHVDVRAVRGDDRVGVDDRAELDARDHVARLLAQHLERAGARGGDEVVARARRAVPVVALVGLEVRPGDAAVGEPDAHEMAVVVGAGRVVDVDRAHVDVPLVADLVDGDGTVGLRVLAHGLGRPGALHGLGRDGLDAAALQGHDDEAVRDDRSGSEAHARHEVARSDDLARGVVDLEELLAGGEEDVAVGDDGLGRGLAVRAVVEGPRRARVALRGQRIGRGGAGAAVAVAGPLGIPVIVRVGRRLRVGLGRRVGLVDPGDLVAGLDGDAARHGGRGLAVDVEMPVLAGLLVPSVGLAAVGDGAEHPTPGRGAVVGVDARGGKERLGEVGRRGALDELDGPGTPGLGVAVAVDADDLGRRGDVARHGPVGAVDPRDGVASLEGIAAGAHLRELTVDEELPVLPGVGVELLR